MTNEIILHNKIFKQYKQTKYFCSSDGDIYSDFSQKILKPLYRKRGTKKYAYVDINFGNGQKHIPIHRLVYNTWIGSLDNDEQVNHRDDNSLNNHFSNLYKGNQKQNISDCFENNHRVGNSWILTIFDKKKQKTITFCPAKDFIEYSGHPCKNGGVSRMFTRQWFQKRYTILDFYLCKELSWKNDVTTIPDECKEVG